jgi:phosphatidylserine/phosphatidylglycerophosphate/cardiolipin synthase-like enzyme
MIDRILPAIGVVQAKEPGLYLLTPFQDAEKAYLAFLRQATHTTRIMIYGFTLDDVVEELVRQKAAGVDIKIIFDRSQASGRAERAEIERLVAGGFKQGVDFVVGTSPEHHAINHLKATWIDGTTVWHGSWNYSASANAQYNSVEIVRSQELAALFDQAFEFAWKWIVENEPQGGQT